MQRYILMPINLITNCYLSMQCPLHINRGIKVPKTKIYWQQNLAMGIGNRKFKFQAYQTLKS